MKTMLLEFELVAFQNKKGRRDACYSKNLDIQYIYFDCCYTQCRVLRCSRLYLVI